MKKYYYIILIYFVIIKSPEIKAQEQKGQWKLGISAGFVLHDNLEDSYKKNSDKFNLSTNHQNGIPFRITAGYERKGRVSVPFLISLDQVSYKINDMYDYMYSTPSVVRLADLESTEYNLNIASGVIFNIRGYEKNGISFFCLISCALTRFYNHKYFYHYMNNSYREKGRALNAPRFIFDVGIKWASKQESRIKNFELLLFPSQTINFGYEYQNNFSINFGLMYNFKRKEKIKHE